MMAAVGPELPAEKELRWREGREFRETTPASRTGAVIDSPAVAGVTLGDVVGPSDVLEMVILDPP